MSSLVHSGQEAVVPTATDCSCITETDKMLVAHNATVVATFGLFGAPRRVSLEVEKLDSKKRARPPRLIASYCPFCGVKYRTGEAS